MRRLPAACVPLLVACSVTPVPRPIASTPEAIIHGGSAMFVPPADAAATEAPPARADGDAAADDPPLDLTTTVVRADADAGAATSGECAALSAQDIARIIHAANRQFVRCFNGSLKRDPNLHGRVRIALVIAPQGTVSSATDAGSTLNDAQTLACMTAVAKTLVFPAPGQETTVTIPLNLVSD
jgi:hypothetical protein